MAVSCATTAGALAAQTKAVNAKRNFMRTPGNVLKKTSYSSEIPIPRLGEACVLELRNIEFVVTVAEARLLPPARGAEVAFVGRSNAGKSSALNALAQRQRLAFVSKTPGRTQHINFFRVGVDRYLVDLPGYGYAAVPTAARAHWNELVGGYLQTRASLRGIVLIMDARHPLTRLDWQLITWLKPTGRPLLVLLSKSDKLGRQVAQRALSHVETALARTYPGCSVQLFSSTHRIGVAQASAKILEWLGRGTNKKPPVKGE